MNKPITQSEALKMFEEEICEEGEIHPFLGAKDIQAFISTLYKSFEGLKGEEVVCSAIKYDVRGEERIIRGHRHADCLANRWGRPDKDDWKEIEQGFMTTKNRFVNRVDGLQIQKEAGIPCFGQEDGKYPYKDLYSEDLY